MFAGVVAPIERPSPADEPRVVVAKVTSEVKGFRSSESKKNQESQNASDGWNYCCSGRLKLGYWFSHANTKFRSGEETRREKR